MPLSPGLGRWRYSPQLADSSRSSQWGPSQEAREQHFLSINTHSEVACPHFPPILMSASISTALAYFQPSSPFGRHFSVVGGVTGPFPTKMGGMSSLLILRFNNTNLTGEKVVVFCFFGSEVCTCTRTHGGTSLQRRLRVFGMQSVSSRLGLIAVLVPVLNRAGGPGTNEPVSKWIGRLHEELAEQAAEEKRLQEQARRVEEQVLVAQALRRETEAAAKAEAEKQRLEEAAQREETARQQQALHTPVGRWLVMEANFSDARATRFCGGLEELGISSIQALKVQKEAEQEQLALELKMNRLVFCHQRLVFSM